MTESTDIARNVEVGKQVRELVDLLATMIDDSPDQDRFVEVLAASLPERVREKIVDDALERGIERALPDSAAQFYERPPESNKHYVLVYGCFGAYDHPGQHPVVMVRKAQGTLYEGLLNLPGGKVVEGETPHAAAVREWQEETGTVAGFPQLLGRLLPPVAQMHNIRRGDKRLLMSHYRVDVFSVVYSGRVVQRDDQPVVLVPLSRVPTYGPDVMVANVSTIVALCRARIAGWVLQDDQPVADHHEVDEVSCVIHRLVRFPEHVMTGRDPKRESRGGVETP